MKINIQRLLDNIDRFAQIGNKGRIGVERIALSDEDKQARDLLRSQMIEAGLEVHIDKLGSQSLSSNPSPRRGTLATASFYGISSRLQAVKPSPMGEGLDGGLININQ